MTKDINVKKEELSLEELENVSGGAGPDYNPERGELDIKECLKTLQENLTFNPDPHSKKEKGKLIK